MTSRSAVTVQSSKLTNTAVSRTGVSDSEEPFGAGACEHAASGGSSVRVPKWRESDAKAQKNGEHRAVFWVRKVKAPVDPMAPALPEAVAQRMAESEASRDRRTAQSELRTGAVYEGEWKDNQRHGRVQSHSTAQHSTAQHSTAQHSTARHGTAQHSTAQHSTGQHSTAQHSTAQHSTAQHRTAHHFTSHHITSHHITSHHITSHHFLQ